MGLKFVYSLVVKSGFQGQRQTYTFYQKFGWAIKPLDVWDIREVFILTTPMK